MCELNRVDADAQCNLISEKVLRSKKGIRQGKRCVFVRWRRRRRRPRREKTTDKRQNSLHFNVMPFVSIDSRRRSHRKWINNHSMRCESCEMHTKITQRRSDEEKPQKEKKRSQKNRSVTIFLLRLSYHDGKCQNLQASIERGSEEKVKKKERNLNAATMTRRQWNRRKEHKILRNWRMSQRRGKCACTQNFCAACRAIEKGRREKCCCRTSSAQYYLSKRDVCVRMSVNGSRWLRAHTHTHAQKTTRCICMILLSRQFKFIIKLC